MGRIKKSLLIFKFLVISCNKPATDMDTIVNHLANLECTAISLREQRFHIADQIRFTQDTLQHSNNKEDSVRLLSKLQHLNEEKEKVLQQTQSVANMITVKIDSLRQHVLINSNKRKLFNAALDSALSKRGCKTF